MISLMGLIIAIMVVVLFISIIFHFFFPPIPLKKDINSNHKYSLNLYNVNILHKRNGGNRYYVLLLYKTPIYHLLLSWFLNKLLNLSFTSSIFAIFSACGIINILINKDRLMNSQTQFCLAIELIIPVKIPAKRRENKRPTTEYLIFTITTS